MPYSTLGHGSHGDTEMTAPRGGKDGPLRASPPVSSAPQPLSTPGSAERSTSSVPLAGAVSSSAGCGTCSRGADGGASGTRRTARPGAPRPAGPQPPTRSGGFGRSRRHRPLGHLPRLRLSRLRRALGDRDTPSARGVHLLHTERRVRFYQNAKLLVLLCLSCRVFSETIE